MVDPRVVGCAAPGNVLGQVNTKERLSKLKATSPQRKIAVTCKSPIGDISAVTLKRTDTTLDHSQKAEKVCSAAGGDQSTKQKNKNGFNPWAGRCECANSPAGVELIPEPFSCKSNPRSQRLGLNTLQNNQRFTLMCPTHGNF